MEISRDLAIYGLSRIPDARIEASLPVTELELVIDSVTGVESIV